MTARTAGLCASTQLRAGCGCASYAKPFVNDTAGRSALQEVGFEDLVTILVIPSTYTRAHPMHQTLRPKLS